jgi:putative ABC transport system permease protein
MPDWRAEVRRRAPLPAPPGRESEAEDELVEHLADRYREALAHGLGEEQAVAVALAELAPAPGRAAGHAARPPAASPRRSLVIEEFWRDVRHGLRLMTRAPGFAAVVVLTLALAIGANTAVFSLVNGVLLRPLPFPDAGRLAVVTESLPALGFPVLPFSPPDFEDYARMQRSFAAIAAYTTTEDDLSAGGEAERIPTARVGAALFGVLGVAPRRGRTFTRGEDRPGANVVVISHGLWQRQFGGAESALGATVHLDRVPYTVIGIMPAGFQFPLRGPRINGVPAELWLPVGFTAEQRAEPGMLYNYTAVGRLAEGVSLAQAADEAKQIGLQIEQAYPARLQEFLGGSHLALPVLSMREQVVGEARAPLLLLLGAVTLVLLVACANVANLLLSRGTTRQRELSVRAALGAGRGRLVRQSAAESLALALAGGGLGLVLAVVLLRAGLLALPRELPLMEQTGLDARVLAATVAVSLAASVLFGIAPGLAAAGGPLNAALRQDARAGTSRGLRRALRGFAVAQFAGALVLLTGAGLLLRSFSALLRVDPGFQPRHALALSAYLPAPGYPTHADIVAFGERLLERLASLPGVETLGASSDLPFAPTERRAIKTEGVSLDSTTPPVATQSWVMGDYFRAAGIPLRSGRLFGPRDREGSPSVVIVSESLARRFWPGQDPLGKRMRWGEASRWLTVVGVVGDVKEGRLTEAADPHTYTPLAQERPEEIEGFLRNLNVVLRVRSDPPALMAAVRREVAALDPRLAVANLRLLTQDLGEAVAPQRFQLTVVAAFALLGLTLAAVGIYGILSHFVGQQTREIGVRMALGARAGDVWRAVVGEGARLAVLGALVGLVLALALARLLRGLLFGVGAYDAPAFVAAPLLLGLVAVVACGVPAWRAVRVDPAVALRQE